MRTPNSNMEVGRWKMALLVCFYLLSSIFHLQTARGAANTNLLTASFNRTNGMFVAPTNPQMPSLTVTGLLRVGTLVATNAVVTVTNESFVAGGLNTNEVIVSGGGTVAANGIYRWSGARFTNGVHSIFYESGSGEYAISNATLRLYSSPFGDLVLGLWDVVSGTEPGPATVYGPITNTFTTLIGQYPLALPVVSTNLYVDALFGNDTNAVVGRIDRPWRNVAVAIGAARSGQSVRVGPGLFVVTNGFVMTNGVSLEGSGIDVTVITNAAAEVFYVGANCRVANLTSLGLLRFGRIAFFQATNVLVENCSIRSAADALYLDWWGSPFVVQNCPTLVSDYDVLADFDPTPGDRVIRIRNCGLFSIGPVGNFPLHVLSGASSRYEFYGCSLVASNGVGANFAIWLAATGDRTNITGSVLLSGTSLLSLTTNGGDARTIVVSNNQHITYLDAVVPLSQVAGNGVINSNIPTVFSGTNSPESVWSASVGSLFLRKDGGAATSLYTKTNGAGNTGWSAR